MDPRHLLRTKIVNELYSEGFTHQPSLNPRTKVIIDNLPNINAQIEHFAPKFPLDKIAKVDLAILQMAIYELTIEKKEPPKVIINEAVELAREIGSDKSYSFVNAVLGNIYKESSKV